MRKELFAALELIGQANNSEPPGLLTESPTKAIIFDPFSSASPIQPHLVFIHLKDLLRLNPKCRQQLQVCDVYAGLIALTKTPSLIPLYSRKVLN